MKFMVYVLLVAVVALSAVVSIQFEAISKSRSDAREKSLQTWHQVICSIERATLATPTISKSKKKVVIKFYDGLLVNIGAEPCGLEIK